MEFPLVNATGAEAMTQANYPEIHLFTVRKDTAASPLDDVKGHWDHFSDFLNNLPTSRQVMSLTLFL